MSANTPFFRAGKKSNKGKNKKGGKKKSFTKKDVVTIVTDKSCIEYGTQLAERVLRMVNPTYCLKIQTADTAIVATAGAVASVVNVSAALINNFTTRYGIVFREYCIIGMSAKIRPIGANTGILWGFVDELDSSSPTLSAASRVSRATVALNNSSSEMGVLKWRLGEVNDAGYTLCTSTAPVPFYLKFYTDTTLGTTVSATVALLEIHIIISFRGLI
jgi:hypothetical protein